MPHNSVMTEVPRLDESDSSEVPESSLAESIMKGLPPRRL